MHFVQLCILIFQFEFYSFMYQVTLSGNRKVTLRL